MLKKSNLESIIKKEKKVKKVSLKMVMSLQTVSKWLNRYRRFGEESLWEIPQKKYPRAHNRISKKVENTVIVLAEEYWYDGVETLSDRFFLKNIN